MKEKPKSGTTRKQLMLLFFLIMFAGPSFDTIFCQINEATPTRQSSIEYFNKGNFEQAYSGFSHLLMKYPKDPVYKYYSGACLVMMKRDPDKAFALLQQSLNGSSVVRSLPADALFYLGRAQQMTGRFSEAKESYALYTEQAGKKAAREKGVPGFIQECNQKKGMVETGNRTPGERDNVSRIDTGRPLNIPLREESSQKPFENDSSVRKELQPDYENILEEALKLQSKADSLNLLSVGQKKELDKLPENERRALAIKIVENESLAISFQKSADQKYNDIHAKMNPKKEISRLKADSALPVGMNISEPPVLSSRAEEKILIDPEMPSGLIYRIQIAVFRNPVTPSFFRGITPVYGFKVAGTDKTNYFAGMFRKSSDARKALPGVKDTGFKDAFIVAFSGNKILSSDRATLLEKEWGDKPFVAFKTLQETQLDTLPPTLTFRVEVIRSLKALKEEVVGEMRKVAGDRGLDIHQLDDGSFAYLIGKFITFESAAEYADLLIRNNYREARVVAWLGNREVPVETARQLFNNLK